MTEAEMAQIIFEQCVAEGIEEIHSDTAWAKLPKETQAMYCRIVRAICQKLPLHHE